MGTGIDNTCGLSDLTDIDISIAVVILYMYVHYTFCKARTARTLCILYFPLKLTASFTVDVPD